MVKWIDAGPAGDLGDGHAISIPVGRRMVAVARSGRGRQEDRVVAKAMAAPRLPQVQATAEHRVVGDIGMRRLRAHVDWI